MAVDKNLPYSDDKTVINKCHVSKKCQTTIWKPNSYASRFLTIFEMNYSINELELLVVVVDM